LVLVVFQVPLSGSHSVTKVHTEALLDFLTFNSLSRDHDSGRRSQGSGAFSILLSTPSLGITGPGHGRNTG